MDFPSYRLLVKQLTIGKHLPEAIYIHQSALETLPDQLQTLISSISKALKITDRQWHLLKLYKRDFKLTLLSYPTFFEESYPPLHHSYTIDLTKLSVREADYTKSENPPILHRRETFVAPNHPQREFFSQFTQEGEAIGLYENTRIIGFKLSWCHLIKRKGYYLDEEGHLQPLAEKPVQETENPFNSEIERHKTALSRDKLSVPLFLIAQRGYLNGEYSILDYGCGKGDDLRELEEHGIDCIGWDPAHRPDVDLEPCDIVNLGFVLNVIEDKEERNETLRRAYSYANKLLIVSAMLGNERIYERFKPYKDGVITARNTFQRYYMQGELQQYVESTLEENAITLGPGVFVVFKDKLEEQRYLLERHRTRHQWRQLSSRPPRAITQKKAKDLFEKHNALFEDFWYTCLDLGRLPANDEFEHSDQIRQVIDSHNKAYNLCKQYFDDEQFHQAHQERTDDLLVYFALSFFKKRDAYVRMPQSLQRDIKAFFGKYSNARELGKALLFSISKPELIYDACVEAHVTVSASQLNGQHDLIFHKQYLNQCPKVLRVYIGCATQMYGELDAVNLIKAHIQSGKVSLMVYDDWEKDVPLLKERIKIKMREQDIDFFDYVGEYEPKPLENKSAYILMPKIPPK
ncbi:MAG: DNA phosphorothioation-associated putative methyltransferase [Pseudomonadales bacterium]